MSCNFTTEIDLIKIAFRYGIFNCFVLYFSAVFPYD